MTTARRELMTLGESVEAAEPIPQSVQDQVRRLVVSRARDRDDCRILLEALGLTGDPDLATAPENP